MIGQFGTGI